MNRIDTTLEVLIVQLNNQLRAALNDASMAETAISAGHRNQAVGCLLPSEENIRIAASVLDTILEIHRTAPLR